MESRAYIGRVDIDRYFAIFEVDETQDETPIKALAEAPKSIESRVPLKPYVHESEILIHHRQFNNRELESASNALKALKSQLEEECEVPQACVTLSPQKQPKVRFNRGGLLLKLTAVACGTALTLNYSQIFAQEWAAFDGYAALKQVSENAQAYWQQPSVAQESQPDSNQEHFRKALNAAAAAAEATQVASTPEEWQAVSNQWKVAIAHLQAIPADHPLHSEAKNRLKRYQTGLAYASQEIESFREGVNVAFQAAQLVQTAHTRSDWQTVARTWQQAIKLMQAVPQSSPNYSMAQEKVAEYAANAVYAQEHLEKLSQ